MLYLRYTLIYVVLMTLVVVASNILVQYRFPVRCSASISATY